MSYQYEASGGIIRERPRLTMPPGIDEALRVRSLGERIVHRRGAVKSHAYHFTAEVAQCLRLVLGIVTVLPELGVLVILARGDVKHLFGRMR